MKKDKYVKLDKFTRVKNPRKIKGEKGIEFDKMIITDDSGVDRIFIGRLKGEIYEKR